MFNTYDVLVIGEAKDALDLDGPWRQSNHVDEERVAVVDEGEWAVWFAHMNWTLDL